MAKSRRLELGDNILCLPSTTVMELAC